MSGGELEGESANEFFNKHQRPMDQVIPGVSLYYPTYVMPYYYSYRPNSKLNKRYKIIQTKSNEEITPNDLKYQISFSIPFFTNILDTNINFKGAYTQVSYWQSYNDDPYFRETNYQPEAFFEYNVNPMLNTAFGLVHQSNGLGSSNERSWNRAYTRFIFSGSKWMVAMNLWFQINPDAETTNRNIAKYLGYGNLIMAYKIGRNEFSFESYNFIESRFQRSSYRLGWSFLLFNRIRFYVTHFRGYGQSLIEYDVKVKSFGFGLSLNDWF